MMLERRRSRQLRLYGNGVAALAASVAVLGVLGAGLKTIPALGSALVPGHGAWRSAAGATLPRSQTLTLSGLTGPATVSFTRQGVASISASTRADAFLALGYVHATFRLTQMDLVRRAAEGRLAELAGPSAVPSDKFELRLGLLGIAEREWAAMPKSSQAARALVAYSRGVNDYLGQARASDQWPAVYSLAGVYPANWTPIDSLLVQGELTQQLDFSTEPLDYALLERSLGAQRTMDWFPVQPPNQQHPYDPGPYRDAGLTSLPAQLTAASGGGATGPAGSAGSAQAAAAILAQTGALPAGQIHTTPDSNAWAVNGPKVAGGGAILAGDPHLLQSLPSIWYETTLTAPGLQVSGVSVPGLPGVLIGHNARIAWSITNTQNQSTLFYDEQTSASRPGEYFWDGHWRRMQVRHYQIPVRGGATQQFTVDATVHGPVLTEAGQTVSVDWMGALGSPDLTAMLGVDEATDFSQFRSALASWRSPTLNFVYADDRGNIGAIAPGNYPLVRQGDPWLPMPGTGADDVAGVIPYPAVPHVYDPSSHVIVSANQRPVSSAYPYYIGTSANLFDPGYRAGAEYAFLGRRWTMHQAASAALQGDVGDQLAAEIVPKLLAALKSTPRSSPMTAAQQQAEQVLASWNTQMTAASAGASIWWTFWSDYLSAVFQPWWSHADVPVHLDHDGLSVGPDQVSLDEDLQAWTLGDQRNPAFSPPRGPSRTAPEVMRTAFATAVSHLTKELGAGPSTWAWGRLHTRQFPSVTGAAGLGYGPRAAGGDFWTVDAAEGGMNSEAGPSWRMIVSWTGPGQPSAEGMYPGGQSENPASPWYQDLVSDWWNGHYLPVPWPQAPARQKAAHPAGPAPPALEASWELRP
jgi:penicillin amidase